MSNYLLEVANQIAKFAAELERTHKPVEAQHVRACEILLREKERERRTLNISAHIEHNPNPWSEIVYVVAGTHSQIAFFNKQSAEQFISERIEPWKYAIHEFVKRTENTGA